MATQDNNAVLSFGTLSAVINRPTQWALMDSPSGATQKLARQNLSALVDANGNTITDSTLATGTVVTIPTGDLDLSLTGGDLAESGRVDVLEEAVNEQWFVAMFDSSNNEVTSGDGLSRPRITASNFS